MTVVAAPRVTDSAPVAAGFPLQLVAAAVVSVVAGLRLTDSAAVAVAGFPLQLVAAAAVVTVVDGLR